MSFCVKELHVDLAVRDNYISLTDQAVHCDVPKTHVSGLRPFKGSGLRRGCLTSCILFPPGPGPSKASLHTGQQSL